jgi:hypothetical protein
MHSSEPRAGCHKSGKKVYLLMPLIGADLEDIEIDPACTHGLQRRVECGWAFQRGRTRRHERSGMPKRIPPYELSN